MNNEAFNAAVSNLTTFRIAAPVTCNVDLMGGGAALANGAFADAVGSADAANNEELSISDSALALQRSRLTSGCSSALLHQQLRGSHASYLRDAPLLHGSLFPYDTAASRAPDPDDGARNLQHTQKQQQWQNHFVLVDSAAAYREAEEKGCGNALVCESEAFCDMWGPPRETLEQQQLRLEFLQQNLNYCDERCTLGRTFRAREAAVRARLLYDQLQKQQQAQRVRYQRNAKLMEDAVSSTNQKLMAPPPHAAQRLALCLAELHKQMQQRLDPPTFAAATKMPGIGGTSVYPALDRLNVPLTLQQGNRSFPIQCGDADSPGGPARTAFGDTSTGKTGQTMSALYESEEDLAAAKKAIETRALILLSQQEGASRNNVQSSLWRGSAMQAHIALQRAKGSSNASKCVTEATSSEFGCATHCSSPRIPEEISSTCTKTTMPPSPPQKLFEYSERLCRNSRSRHKSASLPRKTSRSSGDNARKDTATGVASDNHQLLKLDHKASALGGFPLQLHNAQQVRLQQQQRGKRHHNIRQSLQSLPEGGSPAKLFASAALARETSRVLTASHAVKVELDSAPSETPQKASSLALDIKLKQTCPEEQQGAIQAKSIGHRHRRQQRRHKQRPQEEEGQLDEQKVHHLPKPTLTHQGSPSRPLDAAAQAFSSGTSSRCVASRTTSPSKGIHYLQGRAQVAERPNSHLIMRGVPLQQNTTSSSTSLNAQSKAKPETGRIPPMTKAVIALDRDIADSHDTPVLSGEPIKPCSASCTSKAEPPTATSSAASREEAHSRKEPLQKKISTSETNPMSTQAIGGSTSAENKRESVDMSRDNGTFAKGHLSTNDLVRFLMDIKQGGTV
ncbi:hypothetical protein Emag_001397 [Eimeria magna]